MMLFAEEVHAIVLAREGSRFTLLFEQAALMLAREMPVLAAARLIDRLRPAPLPP